MPAEHDLDPDAMTENERLAKRRYQAGFAFETMQEPPELVLVKCHGCDVMLDMAGRVAPYCVNCLEGYIDDQMRRAWNRAHGFPEDGGYR